MAVGASTPSRALRPRVIVPGMLGAQRLVAVAAEAGAAAGAAPRAEAVAVAPEQAAGLASELARGLAGTAPEALALLPSWQGGGFGRGMVRGSLGAIGCATG